MGRLSRITSLFKLLRDHTNRRFVKVCSSATFDCTNYVRMGRHMVHTRNLATENVLKEVVEKEKNCAIEDPVPHEFLVERLLKCSSVADQMRTLSETVSLSAEDIQLRQSVAMSIKDMLSPFFQNFEVDLFGSTINSYGFKGCDIDMVFYTNVAPDDVKQTSFDDSDIPSPEAVLKGLFPQGYMDTMSSRDQLLFIHTVFLDYYKECNTAPIFINSYVPLIRFLHDRYQLKIDLTSANRFGIYNSKLLHIYGRLDDRILPLLMTIRYWGKYAGIVGKGLMFNTYCLTLLAIYFLQTRTPPVLPTVEQVTSLTDEIVNTDMSEETYKKILRALHPSKNTETLEELLREFFFFYLYFDFGQVVCPLSGSCMSRSEFNHSEEAKKFRFNTICVQDPFKLTHNVANLVDYKHCKKFARVMLSVCKLFQDDTVWHPQSGIWGIAAMMEAIPAEKDQDVEMFIPLKGTNDYDTTNLIGTAKTVLTIFERCLLFKVLNVQEFRDADEPVCDGDLKLLMRWQCDGHANTFMGRNSIEIDDGDNMDALTLERTISIKLCQREKIEERDCSSSFGCSFYATKENGKLSPLLKLDFTRNQSYNTILGIFLKEYLPKVLTKVT